jgi:adenine deaminase
MIAAVVPPAVSVPAGSVHITPRRIEDFRLRVESVSDARARLKTIKGVRFSEWGVVEAEVKEGYAVLPPAESPNGDLNFIYVQHRHGRHESRPQMALQEGLPRLNGALATTYLHDSHNLFVIGGNAEDMMVAANTLIECGGGIVAVQNGKVLSLAAFPIAGMLSPKSPDEVARDFASVREAAGQVAEWKLPYWIFKSLEGMSLACNPFPYLTDLGLADGKLGELVGIEAR